MSRLVLASASPTRRRLLEAAGLAFTAEAAAVDEEEIRHGARAAGLSAAETAEALAETKARRLTGRHAGALVLGCDQMLDCEGRWFDKPANADAAREQLRLLRGRTHVLTSVAVILRDGQRLWHATGQARLIMRDFSDAFLDGYLHRLGPEVTGTVGAYRLEGEGVQLFQRVEGDWFTIMGLPLLPLLAFLREHGLAPS